MPTAPTGPQGPPIKPVYNYVDPGTGKTVYQVRGLNGVIIETTRLKDVQVVEKPFKGVDWKPKPKLDINFGPPPPATAPPPSVSPPPPGAAPPPGGGGGGSPGGGLVGGAARGLGGALLGRGTGPVGVVIRTGLDAWWLGGQGMEAYLRFRDDTRPRRFDSLLRQYRRDERIRRGGEPDPYRSQGQPGQPYEPTGDGKTRITYTAIVPGETHGTGDLAPQTFEYRGYLKNLRLGSYQQAGIGTYLVMEGEFSDEIGWKSVSAGLWEGRSPTFRLDELVWIPSGGGSPQNYQFPPPGGSPDPTPPPAPDGQLSDFGSGSPSPGPGPGAGPTGGSLSSAGPGSSSRSSGSPGAMGGASPSPGGASNAGSSPGGSPGGSPGSSGSPGGSPGGSPSGIGSSSRAPSPSPATVPSPGPLPFLEPPPPLPAPNLKPPDTRPETRPSPPPNELKQPDNQLADAINLAAKISILTMQTSKKAIVEAVEEGTCAVMQPGKCGDEALKRNNNDLLNKLGLGAQAADLTLLAVINSKLGPEVPGGISGALGRVSNIVRKTWDFLQIDRVLNVLTFWVTLHNAMMLSSNVAQTLFSTAGNLLAMFGIGNISEDGTVTPFDVSTIVNQWLDNFFKGVFGAENYSGMKAEWKKWNRIYQAAANVVWSIQSIAHSILSVLEVIGSHISKIGNALRKWGTVGEKAYGWMNPQPNYQNRFFTALERTEEVVSQVNMVSSEILSAQDAVSQIGKQKEDILRTVGQTPDQQGATIKPGAGSPEASQVKAQEDAAKANSQAVSLGILDLIKPEG